MEQRFPKRVKAYQMHFIKMNVKRNQNEDEIENIPISGDIRKMIKTL